MYNQLTILDLGIMDRAVLWFLEVGLQMTKHLPLLSVRPAVAFQAATN